MKIAHQLQNKCIFTIIKEFKLNNPHLIGLVENKLDLFKFLSKNGKKQKNGRYKLSLFFKQVFVPTKTIATLQEKGIKH